MGADDLEAKKAMLAAALIQAKQTKSRKCSLWIPLVAKTRLAGGMAERERIGWNPTAEAHDRQRIRQR